jgi:hypothetical protein
MVKKIHVKQIGFHGKLIHGKKFHGKLVHEDEN